MDSNDVHFEEIPTDYCTREELGLVEDADEVKLIDRDGALFFPTHRNSINDLTFYSKKYKCIKEKKVRI